MNEHPPHGRPLIFGEVLFDHFPDGARVLGGAPINVAWHLQAFAGAPLLVTRVGRDQEGRDIEDRLSAWGMDTSGLQTDQDHGTGAVNVGLSEAGDATFDIIDDRAFDYIRPDIAGGVPPVDLLYHGSLALRHDAPRTSLATLKDITGAPTFVDINLRDPWWTMEDVLHWVGQARWLKINDDELDRLCGTSAPVQEQAAAFRAAHELELLVVTRGAQGSFALGASGEVADVPLGGRVDVVDTVGAGDAFAAVLILGILRNWSLPETMSRAQDFASAVVGLRGATTDDPDFYAPFLEHWN